MNDLGSISRIFKKLPSNEQTDGAVFFMLIKQILHDVNDDHVFHMSDELFDILGFSASSGTCDDAS